MLEHLPNHFVCGDPTCSRWHEGCHDSTNSGKSLRAEHVDGRFALWPSTAGDCWDQWHCQRCTFLFSQGDWRLKLKTQTILDYSCWQVFSDNILLRKSIMPTGLRWGWWDVGCCGQHVPVNNKTLVCSIKAGKWKGCKWKGLILS